MKTTPKLLLLAMLLTLVSSIRADEGMWMLGNLNKQTRRSMKELGLKLPAKKLYDPKKPSLKDAVVSFGGFCTGVVVSPDGLLLTNHHCGFQCVQQHSTVEHDYIQDGFVARTREEELPNPELYVRFLLRTEDVTPRVLSVVSPSMSESERTVAVDSVMMAIGQEVSLADSTLVGVVDPYYGGNEFWLSVYRDFYDVRLVFAPPSSIGKFGWDKDNWEWPRHTGDFCVFRIYADRDNRPADYSPDNVPYRPAYVAPVSLEGYREGSFCMTLGYPGTTERYLSSYGIEEMMACDNQARIDIRGVKQAIWKREMDRREDIRIKYASKYDESSNYWKNSIGVNRAIRRLNVLDKKRAMEQELHRWIREKSQLTDVRSDEGMSGLLPLFTDLELAYRNRRDVTRAQAYFVETFFNGPELVQQALMLLNLDFEGEEEQVITALKKMVEKYDNMDEQIDREVFTALLREYRQRVDTLYWPEPCHAVDSRFGGSEQAYVDTLYEHSLMDSKEGLRRFLANDTTYVLFEDPAINLCIDLLTKYFEMEMQLKEPTQVVTRGERLLTQAVRRMYSERNFYPDANSSMRLSFGAVGGYDPFDGAHYDYYTTSRGILQKVKAHAGDVDFAVQPQVLRQLSSRDFGPYADEQGDMRVCFISNNDITGGNSGSPMFNARGELLGLAFDGNWEAMSSDLLYEPRTQRCIGVDVRYILFVMERIGHASHLIEEFNLVR